MNLVDTIAINKRIVALILKKAEASGIYELRGPDFTYATQISEDNIKAEDYLYLNKPH